MSQNPKESSSEEESEWIKVRPKEPLSVMEQNPKMVHIIDEDLNLSDQIQNSIKKWEFEDKGLNYNLVAVFGSQSTGKSTLLNLLFGTDFETKAKGEVQQTTKGLWLSVSQIPDTLVMDVEGTDGRERGENQDMERKSAVFSLAVSQVLIVNMFEKDVGRFNGANYGLLKTVLEVNLQLFQASGSPKTLLLFVIRDQTDTPLETVTKILTEDLGRIWAELSKPTGCEGSTIYDFFDLKFTALPHKIYVPEQFQEGVTKLKEWFTNPSDPNYVFRNEYHKQIPADGFYKFVSDIWDKIMKNRDLDLPTQRELLAQFRCDEISAGAFAEVLVASNELSQVIDRGEIPKDLGASMVQLKKAALEHYNKSAHRYDKAVYEKVLKELVVKILNNFYPLFTGSLQILAKSGLKTYQLQMERLLKGRTRGFSEIDDEIRQGIMEEFASKASSFCLQESSWSYSPRMLELRETLDAESQNLKLREIKKEEDKFKDTLQYSLSEPLSEILGEADPDMWEKIQKCLSDVTSQANQFIDKFRKDYACTDEEIAEREAQAHTMIATLFKKKMQESTADSILYAKVKKSFEEKFKYDDQHRPRIWKSVEEINPRFDEAKAQARETLERFVEAPEAFNMEMLKTEVKLDKLVTEDRKRHLWDRMQMEANAIYQEAVNSSSSIHNRIPPWVYPIFLLLGWNELMTILFNPVYLILAVLVGGGAFIIFQLGLQRPFLQMSQTVTTEALRMGRNRLDDFVESRRNEPVSHRGDKLKTM